MPLRRQGSVCVNQPVKPEELRNKNNSMHREGRTHPLFLINAFACGLLGFKGKKPIIYIC